MSSTGPTKGVEVVSNGAVDIADGEMSEADDGVNVAAGLATGAGGGDGMVTIGTGVTSVIDGCCVRAWGGRVATGGGDGTISEIGDAVRGETTAGATEPTFTDEANPVDAIVVTVATGYRAIGLTGGV